MREILFRGKRIDNGERIEGDFLQDRDLEQYMIEFFDYYYDENGRQRDYCQYEVDPSTIGQFTGLTDKNGKKIFEGDIVEIDNRRYTVSFEKGCWVILGKAEFWDFLQTNVKSCKVIGNIHDNPELLEVSGDD